MCYDIAIGLDVIWGRPYIHSHTVQWFSDEACGPEPASWIPRSFPTDDKSGRHRSMSCFIVLLWYLFPASYGHAIHPSRDVLPCPVVWWHYHRPCLNIFQCTDQIVQYLPGQDNIKIVCCNTCRLNVNVSNGYMKQEPTTPTHMLWNWERFISFATCLALF